MNVITFLFKGDVVQLDIWLSRFMMGIYRKLLKENLGMKALEAREMQPALGSLRYALTTTTKPKPKDKLTETTHAILLLSPLEEYSKLTVEVTDDYLGLSIMPIFELELERAMRSDGKLVRRERVGDLMKPMIWDDPRILPQHRDFIRLWHTETISYIAELLDLDRPDVSKLAWRLRKKYGDELVPIRRKGKAPIAM